MRPLLSIWIKPKQTFEFLEKREEARNRTMINTLIFFASMSAGLSSANDITLLFGLNRYFGLLISLIFAGLLGLLLFHILIAPIILLTGKIFQGKSVKKEIKLTIAYAQVPNIVYSAIVLIIVVLALILDNQELMNYRNSFTLYILWLFSLRILIYGLAYFNKYSYGYALLTVLIPATIIQGIAYSLRYILI